MSWNTKMYVLSTDTPTIIRTQSKPHTLAVARILSYLDDIGERERAYATPSHKRFLGASESPNLWSIETFYVKKSDFYINNQYAI